MLSWVLFENPELKNLNEPSERLEVIKHALFKIVYCRVSRGMLNKDKGVLSLLLTQTFIKSGFR